MARIKAWCLFCGKRIYHEGLCKLCTARGKPLMTLEQAFDSPQEATAAVERALMRKQGFHSPSEGHSHHCPACGHAWHCDLPDCTLPPRVDPERGECDCAAAEEAAARHDERQGRRRGRRWQHEEP